MKQSQNATGSRQADVRSAVAGRRFARRPAGIVLIITLLSIVLIAALLAYMMNLGSHTNARIVVQNSADATAMGGATWMARSYNTVAMNNVAMAKYLALANVLDAMPQAVALTMKDETSFAGALSDQIGGANGRDGLSSLPMPDRTFVLNVINSVGDQYSQGGLLAEFNREAALLKPVDQAFNHSGFDIESITTYAPASGGKGKLWAAATALDESNQATMENASVLAQVSADRGPLPRIKRRPSTMRPACRLIHQPSLRRLISPRSSAMSRSTSRSSWCTLA